MFSKIKMNIKNEIEKSSTYNAPAEPRTPIIAMATADSLWPEVGIGKEDSMVVVEIVVFVFVGMEVEAGSGDVKKDVGRAIITTPSREISEAY